MNARVISTDLSADLLDIHIVVLEATKSVATYISQFGRDFGLRIAGDWSMRRRRKIEFREFRVCMIPQRVVYYYRTLSYFLVIISSETVPGYKGHGHC